MRLAEFISGNVEPILVEWESFAQQIWPKGVPVEPAELRDSAAEILVAVVADMGTAQSSGRQREKSEGRGVGGAESDELDHASQVHGAARVGSGLALPAVVAEYRALRASVLRLWRAGKPEPDLHDLDDLTRFNEAIDQSLALAVSAFTRRVDSARKMFLAILGHDLRNPLAAVTLSAKLAMGSEGPELKQLLTQIVTSATAVSDLVTDLIDFTSSSIGAGLPLKPAAADFRVVCDEVAREMRAAHPGRSVHCDLRGELGGTWDPHRLRQVVANLVGNALQHGSATEPVELAADGTAAEAVVLSVHNSGEPIPAELLPTIFNPLTRGRVSVRERRRPGSIGLGLYIVREIVAAHGGTVGITSTAAAGTTVTVRLPRNARR